jgi:type II secretory pathway component PulF
VLFSKRLPLSSLITLCHTLRHNLAAGLSLQRVFRQQAEKGPPLVRPIAGRISAKIDKGDDLESALQAEEAYFPPLFLSMATIGEESGSLPEVFQELEKYYSLQQKLKRQFYSQISWPVFQLVIAIATITLMILIIGMLASNPEEAYDPLGFGVGPGPAVRFLAIVFLILATLACIYFGGKHVMKQKGVIDEILLRIPVIGPTIRAFALTRFCLGLRLTMETGMPITRAVDLSLRATDNDAFISKSEQIRDKLSDGEELAPSIRATRIFPENFENILANAEESGRMTQVLEHQAKYYEEESSRRLTILATVAGWGVWLVVAIFLVVMILRMAFKYIGLLDPAKYGIPQ